MELWIRTQRKERLCRTYNFVIREANKQGYYAIAENRNKNTIEYGIYKTKERALEVLDEIQKIFKPQLIIKDSGKIVGSFEDAIIRESATYEFKELSTYVYEMPEE